MSNSKMMLCCKPSVLEVFERGKTAERIPEDGASIVYGEMMLQDPIPLSWKVPPTIHNQNCLTVSQVAAEMLGIISVRQLVADYMRASDTYSKVIPAHPGDFVVVMPLAGLGEDVRYDDAANCSAWFDKNKVKVAFVGSELPPDVAHVYRHVQWNRLHIEQPDPIADAIKAQGNMKVTIFDALKMNFCTGGVEAFQKEHFPGRTEATLNELLPHMDNEYVERLVRHLLGRPSALRSRFQVGTCREQIDLWANTADKYEKRRKNLRPLAQALGVDSNLWL